VNGPVFYPAITIIIIIALTLFKRGRRGFTATQNFVANKAGWFYIKCKFFSNIYDLFGFSKFGQLRIGGKR
jgi:choline/glycine/proline betaine transport protein